MKKLLIAVALAGASLSACTANQALQSAPVIGNVCAAAQGTLIDEKALLDAQAFYNVPTFAYVEFDRKGQLSADLKASLKPKLIKLYSLLQAVKAAKGTVNCDFNSMKQLSAEVKSLLPAKGK